MDFVFNPKELIGIDCDGESLRLAMMQKKNKSWEVRQTKKIDLHERESVNQIYKSLKKQYVVSCLPAKDILIRRLVIALKKEREVFKALDFQAEPLLPFAVDNAILQGQITEQQGNSSDVTLFAARKDHVMTHLSTLMDVQVEPDAISTTAEALVSFASLTCNGKSQEPLIIVHLNGSQTLCVLAKGDHVLAQRSIGLKEDLLIGVEKAVLSLLAMGVVPAPTSLVLVGQDRELLSDEIQKTTGLSVFAPNSILKGVSEEQMHAFAVAIGLAASQSKKRVINFRKQEFCHPRPLRHIKKAIVTSIFLTGALALAIGFWGMRDFATSKQMIQKRFAQLEQTSGLACSDELDLGAIERQVSAIEQEILTSPLEFPIVPNIPSVSTLLHWISEELSFRTQPSNSIMIESIDYKMVSRPSPSAQKERYLVRVQLEFKTPSALAARTFKELISAPNPHVDTSRELEWSQSRGVWKTSFFLKDKTVYG